MEDNLLNHLYELKESDYTIINDFLKILFPNETPENYNHIRYMLKALEAIDLIKIDSNHSDRLLGNEIQKEGKKFCPNLGSYKEYGDLAIRVKITYSGRREVEKRKREALEERQIQSGIDTNASVKSTNRIQKIVLCLTAGLAALTLIISVFDLLKKQPINIAPASIVLPQESPSKDSMIRLIQSVIDTKDSVHIHP